MILIIVSSLSMLCVFVIICLLIIGKRADLKMELSFINRLNDLRGVDNLRSLPDQTAAKAQTWVFPNAQQELTVNAMSS